MPPLLAASPFRMGKSKAHLTRGHGLPPRASLQLSGTEIQADVDASNINAMTPRQGADLAFHKFNIAWKFPPLPQLQRGCNVEDGLQSIEAWCRSFIQLNHHGWHVLSSHDDFLLEAFSIRVNRWPVDEWDNRPPKSRYREIVRAFSSREGSDGRVKEILKQGLNPSNHPTLNIPYSEAQRPEQAMTDQEVDELRTYFPGVPKDATFCISCASYGHRSNHCPANTCRFCGDKSEDHLSLGCPKHRPCQQHRHDKAAGGGRVPAGGKPATKSGPKISCAMCGSPVHSMDDCPQVWCTYFPSPDKAHRVRELPVFCYYCGEAAHFGADCLLNHGEHLSGRQYSVQDDIWSSRYSALFIDKKSSNLSVVALDATAAVVGSVSQEETEPNSLQPTPSPKKKRNKKETHSNGQDKSVRKVAPPKTQNQPKKRTKTVPSTPPKPPDKEKQPRPQPRPQPQPQEKRKKWRQKKRDEQAVSAGAE